MDASRGFSSRGGFETLYPLPEKPEESIPLSYLETEFDRQASATVQRMFDEINQMLFEGKPFDGSPQLLSECQEWCTKFPHLRICGQQNVVPQDQGTKYIPLSSDDPRVYNYRPQTSVLEDMEDVNTLDSQGLMVQGTQLNPTSVDYTDLSVQNIVAMDTVVQNIVTMDTVVKGIGAMDTVVQSIVIMDTVVVVVVVVVV
ncbi:hypothetical protein QZH41_012725 [Actinostola sp. cb2023]|nr:hypothetical protein QZH41_012725 [Actinostola sp. cb2023]